jgi:hypothetical protein
MGLLRELMRANDNGIERRMKKRRQSTTLEGGEEESMRVNDDDVILPPTTDVGGRTTTRDEESIATSKGPCRYIHVIAECLERGAIQVALPSMDA